MLFYPKLFCSVVKILLKNFLVSAVATGGTGVGREMRPLTAACAPHFGLFKVLFLKYHSATKQQAMMEKEW